MQDKINQPVADVQTETWFMYTIRSLTPHCGFGKSIVGALVVLFWDVGIFGSYLFSFTACPIWFLVSIIKNAIQRPGWKLALIRIAIPVAVMAIAIVNEKFQYKIGKENVQIVIKACEDFHTANGKYPKTLDELVPRYLPSTPRAKYCLVLGEFHYWNFEEDDGHAMLVWYVVPPYGRKIYSFDDRRWGYID